LGNSGEGQYARVLIVDDHPLFAEALGDMLRSLSPGIEIEFAGRLEEARARLKVAPQPSMLFFDLGLPDSPAARSLAICQELAGGIPYVVMSAHDEPLRIRQALQDGAVAFLSKSLQPADIMSALAALLSGRKPALALNTEALALQNEMPLSPRQCAVMDCLAAGMANKEIAARLGVTPGTVKVHLREIFARLGAHNRTEAVALYLAAFGKSGS